MLHLPLQPRAWPFREPVDTRRAPTSPTPLERLSTERVADEAFSRVDRIGQLHMHKLDIQDSRDKLGIYAKAKFMQGQDSMRMSAAGTTLVLGP